MKLLVILAAVIAILIFVLWFINRRAKSLGVSGVLKKTNVYIVLLIVVLTAVFAYMLYKQIPRGYDPFSKNPLDAAASEITGIDSDTVSIRIHEDKVFIGKSEYEASDNELKKLIFENKDKEFQITDDYALAVTYKEVLRQLEDNGVNSQNILELTEN